MSIQRKRVGVNHLLCLLVTKASSKFILICGYIWPLFALTHQVESYCPNVLDFNSIPSIKIEHIAKNLIAKSKQRNYFSECNRMFLVYIYLYLLLYCRSFTKILVLSSVKYVDAIFTVNVFNLMLFNQFYCLAICNLFPHFYITNFYIWAYSSFIDSFFL